jgi:hypothetical protein
MAHSTSPKDGSSILKDEQISHLENVDNEKGIDSPSVSSQTEHDPKLASRLRHKIDWRLIPALGAMYGISLMVWRPSHLQIRLLTSVGPEKRVERCYRRHAGGSAHEQRLRLQPCQPLFFHNICALPAFYDCPLSQNRTEILLTGNLRRLGRRHHWIRFHEQLAKSDSTEAGLGILRKRLLPRRYLSAELLVYEM